MKKILFLIPLLGICSTLLAQAPTVTNVQAEQTQGTKDVAISFELTGKPGASLCYIEVWFKTESAQTQWQQVKSIPYSPDGLQELSYEIFDEFGSVVGQDKAFTAAAGESPQNKMFTWNAGNDVPDVNTQDARIRIIAFYPKVNEFGTEKPTSEQKSGWDGLSDFGGSGGSPEGNGTGSPDGNGSSVDSDGDGFSDDDELAAGSDPYNPSSFPGSNDPGSPDGNGSSVDSDGDGFSDDEELAAGSDPYNAGSTPANPGGF